MAKGMRMRAVRRKQMDKEKLALAFLLLAKILNDEAGPEVGEAPVAKATGEEAA